MTPMTGADVKTMGFEKPKLRFSIDALIANDRQKTPSPEPRLGESFSLTRPRGFPLPRQSQRAPDFGVALYTRAFAPCGTSLPTHLEQIPAGVFAPADVFHPYPWLLHRSRFLPHRYGASPDIPNFLLPPFRKPKRVRTAFSAAQLMKLEGAFDKNHYVTGNERKQLADNLNLTETQVKVWFQNRRTKQKRQITEDKERIETSEDLQQMNRNGLLNSSFPPNSNNSSSSSSSLSDSAVTMNLQEDEDDEIGYDDSSHDGEDP